MYCPKHLLVDTATGVVLAVGTKRDMLKKVKAAPKWSLHLGYSDKKVGDNYGVCHYFLDKLNAAKA